MLPTVGRKPIVFSTAARLVYLLITTALLYGLFSRWAYDDPFITYRYAQNLASGQGLVYNPGERVLSTTAPLFALLLAALSPLWPDLPHLATLIGCFSLALGGLFFWSTAQAWDTPAVGVAGLLLYPTFPLLLTTLGSETPFYLAFCLGAFAFYARQRYHWTAIFAALAVLARPDGALVPILLGMDYLLRVRRPIPWASVIVFFMLTLPWFGFAWAYYGSPLPATLLAKQQQGAMVISQHFAPGLFRVAANYIGGWQYWVEAGLACLGIYYLARAARRWALFLAWTVIYFAAYSLLGVSPYYWYYAPLVPGWIALVGLGVAALNQATTDVRRWTMDREKHRADHAWRIADRERQIANGPLPAANGRRRTALLVFGLIIIPLTLGQAAGLLRLRQNVDRRAAIYRAAGEWLQKHTSPGDTVGALEVGIIGYYARRPMVDFAGLIQPQVAAQLSEDSTYEDAAIWAVEHYKPDYLLLNKGDFPRLVAGYVTLNCQVTHRFRGADYNYPAVLLVYACG